MSKIIESMRIDGDTLIALADVSYVERHGPDKEYAMVIFKYSRWSNENQAYEPSVNLTDIEGFISAWCRYRHELEGVNTDSTIGDI